MLVILSGTLCLRPRPMPRTYKKHGQGSDQSQGLCHQSQG